MILSVSALAWTRFTSLDRTYICVCVCVYVCMYKCGYGQCDIKIAFVSRKYRVVKINPAQMETHLFVVYVYFCLFSVIFNVVIVH